MNDDKEERVMKSNGKEEDAKLPEVGTKFMVNGQEYEVVYLNLGKKRFTSVPCVGVY